MSRERPDRLSALAEPATDLAAEQAGRTNDEYHRAEPPSKEIRRNQTEGRIGGLHKPR